MLRAVGSVGAPRISAALIFLGPRGRLRHPLSGVSAARVKRTPGGLDLGPLEPRMPGILRTPERRVRLAPGELLTAAADLSASTIDGGYDLQLIGRRHLRSNNSWLNRVPAMRKGSRRCTVLVHPDDAATRGLQDGQQVSVRSGVGVVELPAELTDEIRPGVVSIPHGWGGPDGGVNTNLLTDGALVDVLSGNAALNATWVAVEPVVAAVAEPARAAAAS